MSGICGWVGNAEPEVIRRMLAAIDYRGDSDDIATGTRIALGYRFWRGRINKAQSIVRDGPIWVACAGTLAPPVACPASFVRDVVLADAPAFDELDGAFGFAHWNEATATLTLGRDPFGVRSLYYVQHAGTFYFATELKQLLAVAEIPVEIDPSVVHKYLTFSFVPGEAVPIAGIRRLLPGHLLRFCNGKIETQRYFQLEERIDEGLRHPREAVRMVRRLLEEATLRRFSGKGRENVGVFLSGGLDSSAVALSLARIGASPRAFSLDFGPHSVEREQAGLVARQLGLEQTWVHVTGESVGSVFDDVVHKLDLPFGDPVTVPQYLLGKAAREAGVTAVFNGEGGDQLFGGWTSKPMVAAEIYSGLYESQESSREETYLHSYHRFYGMEEELYSPEFLPRIGPAGQRRALLRPYLEDNGQAFLNRVRLADIALKGSQNILPRAERMANGWGLDVRTPLFDRKLAEMSFRLPSELKLHGACEKYVFKLAMQKRLPEDIVWRRKYGMSVPVTDFVFSPPVSGIVEELLGEKSIVARGFFRPEFIRNLREGHDIPSETRRRRVGERIWTLLMLEAWMRRFVDRRNALVRSGA